MYLIAAASGVLILFSVSCRKKNDELAANTKPAPIVTELLANQLGSLPGPLNQSQAFSSIRWQPWTQETFDRARTANRLLFCVIGYPHHYGFQENLEALAADAATVDAINSSYVPVLVDGEAAREMGILAADLCNEIDTALGLPMLIWISFEGNPVAWIPSTPGDTASVVTIFNQSHTMVNQMWQDDSSYVLKNSAIDNTNRRERINRRRTTNAMSTEPKVDSQRCIRQLASLYDSFSRTFDETGGLFPGGSIELLANTATHPGLPSDLRQKCLEVTGDLLSDLLPSAMFDPLDGGLFSSRRRNSWATPQFVRDCQTQGRGAVALLAAYRATGDRRALAKALALISFAEKNFSTPNGLFSVGVESKTKTEDWLWSVEDIQKVLGAEDAKWWIWATGMKGLGNIPSDADPSREFFRSNTIGMQQTLAEIAQSQGQSVEKFTPRYEAAIARLLAARNNRFGKIHRDEYPHALSTLRMVSAYAAAFCATGDELYREKATILLKRFREEFVIANRLRNANQDLAPSLVAGRAFLYALAMQSALDVAAITLDETWLVWSEDLATTSAELFGGDDFLNECPDDADLLKIPATDLFMIYDDSTAGLLSISESRLSQMGRPLLESFSRLATPLPTYTMTRPVIHTDLLIAAVARHFPVQLICGQNLRPELANAVLQLPMRMFQRRTSSDGDGVPDGAVKVVVGENAKELLVRTPQALLEALLPSDKNS